MSDTESRLERLESLSAEQERVIGDSLCKFLDGRSSMNQPELEVIRVHILAMKAVFRQELKGNQKRLVEDIGELLLALRNKIDLKSRYGG